MRHDPAPVGRCLSGRRPAWPLPAGAHQGVLFAADAVVAAPALIVAADLRSLCPLELRQLPIERPERQVACLTRDLEDQAIRET